MDMLLAVTVIFFQGYPQDPTPTEPSEFETTIDLRIRGYIADLKGDFQLTDDGLPGTDLDFRSDLDIDRPEPIGGALFRAQITRKMNLWVEGWTGRFEGEDITPGGFVFGGSVYPAGTTVETDITFIVATAAVTLPLTLFKGETLRLEADIGGGIKYLYFSGTLKAVDTPIPFTEKTRVSVAIPVAMGRLRLHIADVVVIEIYASGFGMPEVRNVRAVMFDVGLDVQVYIYRGFYISAGYHVSRLIVEQRDDTEDMELEIMVTGFQIGIGVNF